MARTLSTFPRIAPVTLLALGACATTPVPAYRDLASAPRLAAIDDARAPFAWRADVAALTPGRAVHVEPVRIYEGEDAQLGGASPAQRDEVARYLHARISDELAAHFRIVPTPEPGAAQLRLTLTGLKRNTPFLSTYTHLSPVGFVMNAGRQAMGKGGSFSGSLTFATELFDGSDGKLLYARIIREYPDAIDPIANITALDAARAGARRGARIVRADLVGAQAAETD